MQNGDLAGAVGLFIDGGRDTSEPVAVHEQNKARAEKEERRTRRSKKRDKETKKAMQMSGLPY